MKTGHVFVSHSDRNRAQADALVAELEARGLPIWIAPRDVRPGLNFVQETEQAIEDCGAFLVIVTEDSNASKFVHSETGMAFELGKPIFPVRLSPIKPAKGLTLALGLQHWTDAFGPGRSRNVGRLAEELARSAPEVPPSAHGLDVILSSEAGGRPKQDRAVVWSFAIVILALVALALILSVGQYRDRSPYGAVTDVTNRVSEGTEPERNAPVGTDPPYVGNPDAALANRADAMGNAVQNDLDAAESNIPGI
jgi:hypothetical protein